MPSKHVQFVAFLCIQSGISRVVAQCCHRFGKDDIQSVALQSNAYHYFTILLTHLESAVLQQMWHCQDKHGRMFRCPQCGIKKLVQNTTDGWAKSSSDVRAHCPAEVSPFFFAKQSFSGLRNALFVPSICLCTIPPSLPTSQTLQEIRLRTKGARRLPQVYLRLAENVWNKAALLVTEPSGKQELEQEQTKVLDLMTPHTYSTATVALLKRPLLIRTSSLLKNNMVMWMLAHPMLVTAHSHTHTRAHAHTLLWQLHLFSLTNLFCLPAKSCQKS